MPSDAHCALSRVEPTARPEVLNGLPLGDEVGSVRLARAQSHGDSTEGYVEGFSTVFAISLLPTCLLSVHDGKLTRC